MGTKHAIGPTAGNLHHRRFTSGDYQLIDERGGVVGVVNAWRAEGDANADELVRRWNAFPDLLEALEEVAKVGGAGKYGFDCFSKLANAESLCEKVFRAIAKARGEE